MAHSRCWRCCALMAEEHKGLFEAVTLILAARGLLRLCRTKTFISHMLGTSERSQSEFTSTQRGSRIRVEPSTQHAGLAYIHSHNKSRGALLSKNFQKSFQGKVRPGGGITYSNLIAQNSECVENTVGEMLDILTRH